MFVTDADFDRLPYNLSGLNKLTGGEFGTFQDFVDYHEEENLRELFGNLFYDALAQAFPGLPILYDVATDYVIGAKVVYVINNVSNIYLCIADNAHGTPHNPTDPAFWTIQPNDANLRWVRLVYGDMYIYYNRPQKWYGMKRLVTPLIYALYTKFSYDNQTSSGVVVTNNENSTTVSPAVRIARAMNDYANKCAGDWPEVVDWAYIIWPELENSLFGYLYLDSETWDDLVVNIPGSNFKAYLAYSFQFPGLTNVFGI